MRCRTVIYLIVITISGNFALADCPSADLTGDCFVDFEDFALMANQWPNVYDTNDVNTLANQWLTTDPCVPDDMVYIPDGDFEMGDHLGDGFSEELPLHQVLLDSFFMSKFEMTNQQYCDYLNSSILASDIRVVGGVVYGSGNNQPYCDTHSYSADSQIDYNDVSGTFSVRTKGEPPRDMSDDPMVEVSWYGAAAYCNWRSQQEEKEQCYNLSTWTCDFNKHGYRLPTEAEWEYAARGRLCNRRFPWGDTITHSQANYYSYWEEGHPYYSYDVSPTQGCPPLWSDGIYPYTSPVGFFDGTMKYKPDYNWPSSDTSYQTTSGANNYGLYDMAGNVCEWCNDWFSSTYYSFSPPNNPTGPTSGTYRVLRGGGSHYYTKFCRVAYRYYNRPHYRTYFYYGFRLSLDLN